VPAPGSGGLAMPEPESIEPPPAVVAAIVRYEFDLATRAEWEARPGASQDAIDLADRLVKLSEWLLAMALGHEGSATWGKKRYTAHHFGEMKAVSWSYVDGPPGRMEGAHAATDVVVIEDDGGIE
jgi:hypothetical protein